MKSALQLLLLAALALPVTGCNDPLNVQDPDVVPPGNLNNKSVLPTIRAGAIGDFALAHTGSGADGSGGTVEGVTMYGGLLADEWINSETFPTRIEVDSRGPIQKTNADVGLWFRNMHRGRRAAEFAAERYRTLAPDTTAETGLSEVLSLAGYTYVFFAETWCSGVPVSTVAADGTITYGAPLSTLQLLNTAIGRFDEATAAATALDTTRVSATTRRTLIRLAAVGKARALLDQGQFATAAALVSSTAVPTSFSYTVQHSENTTRENNGVFNATQIFKRYAVGDREGGYTAAFAPSGTGPGLPYRSSGDPRIQWRLVITPPPLQPRSRTRTRVSMARHCSTTRRVTPVAARRSRSRPAPKLVSSRPRRRCKLATPPPGAASIPPSTGCAPHRRRTSPWPRRSLLSPRIRPRRQAARSHCCSGSAPTGSGSRRTALETYGG